MKAICENLEKGFDTIMATYKDMDEAMNAMQDFLSQNLNLYFLGRTKATGAELDKDNLVNKVTKDKAQVHVEDDVKKYYENAKKKVGGYVKKAGEYKAKAEFAWDLAEEVPVIGNVVKMTGYYTQHLVLNSLVNEYIVKSSLDVYDEDGKLVKKGSDLTQEEELEKLKENISKYAVEKYQKLMNNVFGEETAKKLTNINAFLESSKKSIDMGLSYYYKGLKYAKKCAEHLKSINTSYGNMSMLDQGGDKAKMQHEKDAKRLERGLFTGRLDEGEKVKAKETNDYHIAMTGMGSDIADTLQKLNIAKESVNMTVDTVNFIAGKYNYPQRLVSRAIQEGFEFAFYATKVFTDRVALQNYYLTSTDGVASLEKLSASFASNKKWDKSGRAMKTAKRLNDAMKDYEYVRESKRKGKKAATGESLRKKLENVDVIDVIATSKGYEETSELIEDTAMHMAQSICFCASNFNPMMETKLMAITVMLAMGMDKKDVGNVSRETVSKLFYRFKMSR